MESYQVIVTPDAENDLVELRDYIADVLLVPETARSYIRTLREAIGKLGDLLSDVKNGKVGLPDLQRPFVWKDSKARGQEGVSEAV